MLTYLDERRDYDGLIIFTDGYAPVPPKPPNWHIRILWLFNHEANSKAMAHGLRTIGQAAFLKEQRSKGFKLLLGEPKIKVFAAI